MGVKSITEIPQHDLPVFAFPGFQSNSLFLPPMDGNRPERKPFIVDLLKPDRGHARRHLFSSDKALGGFWQVMIGVAAARQQFA